MVAILLYSQRSPGTRRTPLSSFGLEFFWTFYFRNLMKTCRMTQQNCLLYNRCKREGGCLLGFVWRNWLKSLKRLLFTPSKLIDPLTCMWPGNGEQGGGEPSGRSCWLVSIQPQGCLGNGARFFFLLLQVDLRQWLQWARFRRFFFFFSLPLSHSGS